MGKLLLLSAISIPLVVYLVFFSSNGFDPTTVRNQRVLITGASTGIGEQLAYHYAKLGARLVIMARREDALRNVSRACKDLGAQEVHYVTADMADSNDPSKVIEFTETHLGGLDQLILNHAILIEGNWTGSAENFTTLEVALRVNFLSYVALASKALPMLTTSRGRIGVISSGFGAIGAVLVSIYSPCKFALKGFFSSLRQELRNHGAGVSVTFVYLGTVATENFLKINTVDVPVSFMVRPEHAAWAILENVSLRHYSVRFDWKTRIMFFINELFPDFSEDLLSAFMANDETQLFTRFIKFGLRVYDMFV